MTSARSFPLAAWRCLSSLEASRPPALRQYDQIPMRGADLLAQAFDLAPQLVGRSVLFLGDYDGMAPLLLLLEDAGLLLAPKYLTVFDFDHRVLAYHQTLVSVTPQAQRLMVRPYKALT